MRDESFLTPLQAHCLMQLRLYGPASFDLIEEKILSIRSRAEGNAFGRETVSHAMGGLAKLGLVIHGQTEYFPTYGEPKSVIVEAKTAKHVRQHQQENME